MSNSQIPEEARKYIDDILSYMDLSKVEPEVKEQLAQDMFEQLDRFLHARTIDALPEDSLDAYEDLVNSGAPASDIQKFFETHIPNLTQVLTSAAAEFKLANIPKNS